MHGDRRSGINCRHQLPAWRALASFSAVLQPSDSLSNVSIMHCLMRPPPGVTPEQSVRRSSAQAWRSAPLSCARAFVMETAINSSGTSLRMNDDPSSWRHEAGCLAEDVFSDMSFVAAFVTICIARLTRCQRSEEHTSELQSPDHIVCR